ncbi:MAG: cation transporter [Sphingomonadales bacterium]|nr:cation transporter [Sphingomonadales bacterium]PIX67061.1 MAG: cation transporter [Sphingomonadales bacterium CG_4_10_14_3_um_filter_58_15]NCO48266.1 cation transporter [Sphingomonadales bacterium]NCO98747.1 cation transporter [Sphingomonadales bacterium]NCP25736.1 cation transporter [Sphingomonadales bacterium]
MSASHHHNHGHSAHSHHDRHGPHGHMPTNFSRAFALGIALNITYIIVEVVYGLLAGSMALLADAGHNLSDVLGLAVAWAGAELAKRPPSKRFTYGLGGSSILAALLNGLFLLVACGAIALEAIQRFSAPSPIASTTVIIVASVGIVINFGTAMLFVRGQKDDINIRGAFLHMMADAGVSAGVVVGGIVIYFSGWNWIDPLISLLIVVLIFWSTWGLLSEAVRMSLAGVPRNINVEEVQTYLASLPGVQTVHDLHIWPMSTSETAMTAHLVLPGGHPGKGFLASVQKDVLALFSIHHTTIQIELEDEEGALCQVDCHGDA